MRKQKYTRGYKMKREKSEQKDQDVDQGHSHQPCMHVMRLVESPKPCVLPLFPHGGHKFVK